jgi:hypothetical protein
MTTTGPISVTDFIRANLCNSLEDMLGRALCQEGCAASVANLRRLLEALPLASAEFSLAVNRLENAWRFLEIGEFGAARYELRLLRRSLEPSRKPARFTSRG